MNIPSMIGVADGNIEGNIDDDVLRFQINLHIREDNCSGDASLGSVLDEEERNSKQHIARSERNFGNTQKARTQIKQSDVAGGTRLTPQPGMKLPDRANIP